MWGWGWVDSGMQHTIFFTLFVAAEHSLRNNCPLRRKTYSFFFSSPAVIFWASLCLSFPKRGKKTLLYSSRSGRICAEFERDNVMLIGCGTRQQ
jgi:hypothetical protein